MISASEEIADAIGVDYRNLKRSVSINIFSDKMALALEHHLGLEPESLPRSIQRDGAPKLTDEQTQNLLTDLIGQFPDDTFADFAIKLGVHYEKARAIMQGRHRPSIMEVRHLIQATGLGNTFSKYDTPSYTPKWVDCRFGRSLRIARLQAGMSMATLCQHLDIQVPVLSRVENGHKSIPKNLVEKAASVLRSPHLLQSWEEQYGTVSKRIAA